MTRPLFSYFSLFSPLLTNPTQDIYLKQAQSRAKKKQKKQKNKTTVHLLSPSRSHFMPAPDNRVSVDRPRVIMCARFRETHATCRCSSSWQAPVSDWRLEAISCQTVPPGSCGKGLCSGFKKQHYRRAARTSRGKEAEGEGGSDCEYSGRQR